MSRKKTYLPLLLVLCFVVFARQSAKAQYYTWGSDAPMKWSTIRTPDVRMIYPDTLTGVARRTLYYILAEQPSISYGFSHGPMRIPFVLHPENFQSNGLVMYLPKRVEFLTSPAIEGYSMPWYKQLVAHEYRHAVQYNNLNRGVIRVLSYFLGQQGSTIGLLCMPIWAMEGDAVMSETMASSFGRGLQPSFSMGYRAIGNVGADRRNPDRWFCGSYLDYIPDHYELGYQVCSYAYARYGENIWNKVTRFGARNPYMLATTRIALGKYYKTDARSLFRASFNELYRYWDSLPVQHDTAHTLTELPANNYTTYQWPLPLADTAILALKTDYDRPSRFVMIDRRSGRERVVASVGMVSSRPSVGNGRVWWTEYRRSTLFEQRVNSQLCYMDLPDGSPHAIGGQRRVLYPTVAGDQLAWVEYNLDGRYTVVVGKDRYDMPEQSECHGLAWDNKTVAFYLLVTDDNGMHIARIDAEGLHPITEGAYITLSNLRAADGKLYFGSIASGKDEAFCYDLMARRQYRLTGSTYGSFSPMPTTGGTLVTTYDRRGYRVALQSADSTQIEVAPTRLPINLVNPPRPRWDVVNLDTVHYVRFDSLHQSRKFRSRRYRKVPNLTNFHSWMPVAFNPFAAVDEHRIDLNAGVTLISQNLLSNTEGYASYGWNRREGSLLNVGVRYFGLGVHLDFDASYGGNQLFYSLVAVDSQTGKPVYQQQPAPQKYYSVGLTSTLPLYFQCGYHTRQLSVSAGWNYSNGMVADLDKIEWSNGSIHNVQRIGFKKGLHKIFVGVGFSDQVRLAHRDFAPRWGYTLSTNYTFNPANRLFSDLIAFYGRGYLPGFAAHNSLMIEATFQTSVGGYKFPTGYAPLNYKSTRLVPRGFDSAQILSNSYTALAANYQLPIWYPEGGIGSVLYFKRIRLNLGGDYAQFRKPISRTMQWQRLWSVGGDLVFDINAFRQPASATSTVKLSCYYPSEGGVWYGVSFGLPF